MIQESDTGVSVVLFWGALILAVVLTVIITTLIVRRKPPKS